MAKTYAEARGVGIVAAMMLVVALAVAAILVWTALSSRPTIAPQGATGEPTTTQPAMQPAPDELPAPQQ